MVSATAQGRSHACFLTRQLCFAGINPLDPQMRAGSLKPPSSWYLGGLAGPPKAALRVGQFKILTWGYSVAGIDGANATGPLNAPPSTKGADPEFERGPVLYNLEVDAGETTNLAHEPEHAAVLQSMLARLKQLAEEQVYPMTWVRPFQGPAYECAKCPQHPASSALNGGDFSKQPWGPWMKTDVRLQPPAAGIGIATTSLTRCIRRTARL